MVVCCFGGLGLVVVALGLCYFLGLLFDLLVIDFVWGCWWFGGFL